MKHLKSLREFLAVLEGLGDLQPIGTEVDWNLEMGAVIRRSYDLRAPAPLFTAIKGIEPGYRVLGAPGGLSNRPGLTYCRIATALGLPPSASGREIVEALARSRSLPHIPPRIVTKEAAPCKENVHTGTDADLLRLPVPFLHLGDGGRYLQTWGMNVVRTPDGTWTNASVNRMMLVDGRRLACLVPSVQHIGMIKELWERQGEPMPVAVALGVEPGLPYVGGMPAAAGVSELDLLGGYFGEPLETVRCETVPLEVPATAEIVVEGHISHTETALEGPMCEYPGYLTGDAVPRPVLNVTAVTHRDNPILPVVTAGPPVEENHTAWGIPHAAECLHLLRTAELPVSLCWMVPESAGHWLVVGVAPEWHDEAGTSARELCDAIADLVFGGKTGMAIPKILVIEDDVDLTDVSQLVHAFASRAHPGTGTFAYPGRLAAYLPVFMGSEERVTCSTTKVVHNCLLADRYPPGERPVVADFRHGWPPDVQRRVLDNWHAYGYR
ncbi:decarboxylase UbiD [Streptomyces albus subsp. albus]|nr:decarboxylase UbiD [Streptomyces albus subsp. albus]